MTYKGKDIDEPKLEMFIEFCKKKKYKVPPEEVYNHYLNENWRCRNGKNVFSIESMCTTWNGVWIQNERRNRKIKNVSMKFLNADGSPKKEYITYDKQLKDKRWFAFREFILKVRGDSCESCGSKGILNIHHIAYKENCMAWEYTCNDVMVVCQKCHRKIHKLTK